MNPDERYCGEIQRMRRAFEAWISDHPGSNPKVQFNYPNHLVIIAPYTDAVRKKFMSVNKDGEAMLRECCQHGCHEPTPTMIRVAMELQP